MQLLLPVFMKTNNTATLAAEFMELELTMHIIYIAYIYM